MTMKIAILGFGREGKSVLKFLKKRNPRADIKILDQKFDKNYLKNLSSFDVIFRSPGVPYNLPEIQRAIKKGVKFSSATALFFEKAKGKIVGITGTKGKGTTATLLYKILKACNKSVYLAGNIGKPVIEILPKLRKNSIVILELSSFQLQDLKKSSDIAVVLDIFPDHLDLHRNLREYISAKSAISKFQNPNDKVFYFADNQWAKWLARKSRAKKIPVSPQNLKLFKPEDLKIPGQHNFRNAIMATSVALLLGCPKEKILRVVKNFRGNEHRLELVRTIRVYPLLKNRNPRQSASINFYNDSASTNPQTAAAAIRAFKEPKILISGGKDKGLNYSPLAKALKNSNTKLVILFGQNKNKILRQIAKSKVQVVLVKDLKTAVNLAYKTAKKLTRSVVSSQWSAVSSQWSAVNILFSPASASFDMFKDYADRGEKFKELVKNLRR